MCLYEVNAQGGGRYVYVCVSLGHHSLAGLYGESHRTIGETHGTGTKTTATCCRAYAPVVGHGRTGSVVHNPTAKLTPRRRVGSAARSELESDAAAAMIMMVVIWRMVVVIVVCRLS